MSYVRIIMCHFSTICGTGRASDKPSSNAAPHLLPDVVNVRRRPFILLPKPPSPQSSKATPTGATPKSTPVPMLPVLSHKEQLDLSDNEQDHAHNYGDYSREGSLSKDSCSVEFGSVLEKGDEAAEYM